LKTEKKKSSSSIVFECSDAKGERNRGKTLCVKEHRDTRGKDLGEVEGGNGIATVKADNPV